MNDLNNALALLRTGQFNAEQTFLIDRALCAAECNDIPPADAADVIDYINQHLFANREDLNTQTKQQLEELHNALQHRSVKS